MGEQIKQSFAWKRWKIGLLVACISGAATGLVAVQAFVDTLSWLVLVKALVVIFACTAKDFLLYTKQHEVDKALVEDDRELNSAGS